MAQLPSSLIEATTASASRSMWMVAPVAPECLTELVTASAHRYQRAVSTDRLEPPEWHVRHDLDGNRAGQVGQGCTKSPV